MLKHTVVLIMTAAGLACGAGVDFSTSPPKGLKPNQVPQFVSFGFDDVYSPDGFRWILDYLRSKKNQGVPGANPATYDGTAARTTFFVNTANGTLLEKNPAVAELFRKALSEGHEIGNHTRTHSTGASTTLEAWTREAQGAWTDLAAAGIPKDTVVGFRTPFLSYNAATFSMLSSLKFRYDCSIETGFNDSVNGTNFFWPYTLDKGAADPITPLGAPGNIGFHHGLWEVPVTSFIVPPGLRAAIHQRNPAFDPVRGKITGFDYNAFMPRAGNGRELKPGEFLATLKYSLDMRLAGNRAPFTIGAHPHLFEKAQYKPIGNDTLPPGVTVDSLRLAVQAFIDYALSKPEVRIVPFREIVRWCQNPVPLNGSVGIRAVRPAAGRGLKKKLDKTYFLDGRLKQVE